MIPEKFLKRMRAMLGDEYDAFEASLSEPLRKGLRINRVKAEKDWEPPFSTTPIPWARDGRSIAAEVGAGKHPLHAAGAYYLQEPSAMSVAELLAPKPGERVLDLCAAPGGKTTHIASLMQDTGLLVANEIHPARVRVLIENVVRSGLLHTVVLNERPARIAEKFPEYFDRILVDAPCSGEGMFKKSEDAGFDWSEEAVAACAVRQAEILDSAAKCLRAGGIMVYSTCTFSVEENERNVASFLARHPEFRLMPVRDARFSPGIDTDGFDASGCVRIFPHRQAGEGHFAARFQKTDGGASEIRLNRERADRRLLDAYRSFCGENGIRAKEGLFLSRGGYLYATLDTLPDLAGLKAPLPGLLIGDASKGRFEPAHAYALASKRGEIPGIDLGFEDARAVIRGEAIEAADAKGWRVLFVDGFSLGWTKCSEGLGKNRYPKGLRRG